jgi:riboflavin synthase
MFTGLIEGTGRVQAMEASADGGVISIGALPWREDLQVGESVAVNGACLTVTSFRHGSFAADLSPETLARTNLSSISPGQCVNLERPLRLGDRLGGHMVLGHVDGLGDLTRAENLGGFWSIEIRVPDALSRYLVEKGSIAVDGISLTIATLHDPTFTVAVIPKTWDITNLSMRIPGDRVNLEADILAKHIERLLSPGGSDSRVSTEFLAEHGFLNRE